MMSFNKNRQFDRGRKPNKRVLIGETREEEAAAARLEKEIAGHPVTRCKPGQSNPSSSRPGWSRFKSSLSTALMSAYDTQQTSLTSAENVCSQG